MENYGLELALGGIVVFTASFVLTCVCAWRRKKNTSSDADLQLNTEAALLSISIEEIASEKEEVQKGLNERFQLLENWKIQQTPSFFKPAQEQRATLVNTHLRELQSNLTTNLNNYPKFNMLEATEASYLANYHRQILEHHTRVGEVAAPCFQAFDEYLSYLNEPTSESNNVLII